MGTTLSKVATDRLKKELAQREGEEARRKAALAEKEKLDDYMSRPVCSVLGRAYGYPGEPVAKKARLLSIVFPFGSSSVDVEAMLSPSMLKHFYSNLSTEQQTEFKDVMCKSANALLKKFMGDPGFVVTSLCFENVNRKTLSDKFSSKVSEEWKKAALARLHEFNVEELEKARKDLIRNHEVSYGQIQLIDEALSRKKK